MSNNAAHESARIVSRWRWFARVIVFLALAAGVARAQVLEYHPGTARKILQLVGDDDKALRKNTLSRTQTKAGLGSTDLGEPFEHNGKLWFLFGDTGGMAIDSCGYTAAASPAGLADFAMPLSSPGNFAPLAIPGVAGGSYDTPASGTSIGGNIYIIYGTDRVDANLSCTRGVLAKSTNNGVSWTYLYDLSKGAGAGQTDLTACHFIRAHMEQVEAANYPGLPWASGPTVLFFGFAKVVTNGVILSADTCLAAVPASLIENKNSIRYFTGLDTNHMPTWGTVESNAVPIYTGGGSGDNTTVQYLDCLGQWIAGYGKGVYRLAAKPWGPFSSSANFWNEVTDGADGYYIHSAWTNAVMDGFWANGGAPDPWNIQGYGYSAQIIPRWCKGTPDGAEIFYSLSTWNPYQICIMRSEIGLPHPYEPVTNQISLLVPGDTNWQMSSTSFFLLTNKFGQPHLTTAPGSQTNTATGIMWRWLPRDCWNKRLDFDVSGGSQDANGAEILLVDGTNDIPVTGSVSTLYDNIKNGLYGDVLRANWGLNSNTVPLQVSWDLSCFDRPNLKVVIIDKLTTGWGFIDVSYLSLARNVPTNGVALSTNAPGDTNWFLSAGAWSTVFTNGGTPYFSTSAGGDAATGIAWRWLPRDWKNKQLDFQLLGGHAQALLVQGVEPIPTNGDMTVLSSNLLAGAYGTVRAIAQGPDNTNTPKAVSWNLSASMPDKLKVVIIDALTNTGGSVAVSPMTLTRYNTGNHPPTALQNIFKGVDAAVGVGYTNTSAKTKANFTDPDTGDTMTFDLLDGPEWLTLGSAGKASCTNPVTADAAGLNQWRVRVKDAQGEYCDAIFQVCVGNVAPLWLTNPVIALSATQGVAYSATLTNWVQDPNYSDTLTFAKVSGNPWLGVNSISGKLSGTPGAAVAGTNLFVVRAMDSGGLVADATLQIVVYNPPPSAFEISSLTIQTNDVRISWLTAGGQTNLVQAASHPSGTYSNISPPIEIKGAGATSTNFLEPGGATNRSRFYRVRLSQ